MTDPTPTVTPVSRQRGPDDAAVGRGLAIAIVVACVLAVLVTRTLVVERLSQPIGPDAIGPWANALALAPGHDAIEVFALPPYSVGLGALLVPFVLLFDDPGVRYQAAAWALGVSAIAAGWLLTLVLPRIGLGTPLARASAFAAFALAPAMAATGTGTWVEPLVFLWLAAWLAAQARALPGSSLVREVALVVIAASGILVHSRFALVPVTVAAVAGLRRMRAPARHSSGTGAALAASALLVLTAVGASLAARGVASAVIDVSWTGPAAGSEELVGRVWSLSLWTAVVKAGVGQAWYVLVSTAGLAGVGAWALARRTWTWITGPPDAVGPFVAVATAATLVAAAVPSLLQLGATLEDGVFRPDHLVHGRYIEAVGLALGALGAAALVQRRAAVTAQLASLAVAVAAATVVVWFRESMADGPALLDSTITGVRTLPFSGPGLDIAGWTTVGVGIGLLLAAARGWDRRSFAAVLAVLLLLGTWSATSLKLERANRFEPVALYEGYPDAPAGGGRAVVARDVLADTAYRFGYPVQQYVLEERGWRFGSTPTGSSALAADPPRDADMVVLLADAGRPAGEWCALPGYGVTQPWLRGPLAPGVRDGRCVVGPR